MRYTLGLVIGFCLPWFAFGLLTMSWQVPFVAVLASVSLLVALVIRRRLPHMAVPDPWAFFGVVAGAAVGALAVLSWLALALRGMD
jgi:hypothetical protein